MKWLLALFGILLATAAGLYVLLFTPTGNAVVAPMVEEKINTTLPPLTAKLERFELQWGSFDIALQLTAANRIEAGGSFNLFSQGIEAKYRLLFDDLEALQPLSGQTLHGKLHADGEIIGTLSDLVISGRSDVADSRTRFETSVVGFAPASATASVEHASVPALLAMVGQQPLLSGSLDIDAKLKNLDPEQLDGVATLKLANGRLDRKIIKRDYKLSLPDTSFETTADALLEGRQITYDLNVLSALATIASKGKLQPATMAADLSYNVAVKELGLFAAMTPIPLHGPLTLKGSVTGDAKAMKITGTSDLARSQSSYDVALESFQPRRVNASVKGAHAEALLKMLGEAPLVSGTFDLDATLKDLNPKSLDGTLSLKFPKGTLDRRLLKRDYGLDLPDTAFSSSAEALLKGKRVDYDLSVRSAVANVVSKGTLKPETMAMDLNYDLALKELGMLKSVTPIPMRGSLGAKGTVKGDRKALDVKGTSDLAGSATEYALKLQDFQPRSVKATVKNARLQKLLHLLAQPRYADGQVDVTVDVPDARMGSLKGNIETAVTKGVADGKTISKSFDFGKMPKTTFSAKTTTTLEKNRATTRSEVQSSLAKLTSKTATVDFDSGHVHADYRVDLPDLDAFYFATERHLKGAMTLTGDFIQEKDRDITAHAATLGGTIDVKMHNDDLHAAAKKIQTLDALTMLTYPKIFQSTLDGTFDYNVAKKSGTYKADLKEGAFTQNVMLDLLKQLAKADLYSEKFNGTVDGTIKKEKVVSNLDLRGRKSSISGKNILLDAKSKQIDAKLEVVANNNPIGVTVKGNVNKPKVNVDVKKIIQKEAQKVLEKKAGELLKKLF
jgi:hypothetical protein